MEKVKAFFDGGKTRALDQRIREERRIWSQEEMKRLQSQYRSECERSSSGARPETVLSLSLSLSRSPSAAHWRSSIELLETLLWNDEYRRPALYFIALNLYQSHSYVESRQVAEQLVAIDPHSRQARELLNALEAKIERDGVIGLTVAGALATAAAVGLVKIFSGRK